MYMKNMDSIHAQAGRLALIGKYGLCVSAWSKKNIGKTKKKNT